MSDPFFVFPWQKPFLPALKAFMDETGDPARTILIVPHKRPARYLCELYKKDKKTVLLPQILTVGEVVALWTENALAKGHDSDKASCKKSAGILDRVAMFHQAVCSLAGDVGRNPVLNSLFDLARHRELADFLPWGMSLTRLVEEILAQGRQPADLANVEYDLPGPAVSILASLGKIGERWQSLMAKNEWTSRGLDCLFAAEHSDQIPAWLMPGEDRLVCIAGFARPSGSEERIFRSLWQAGAKICLHGDPALASGGRPHFACEPLRTWQASWRAGCCLAGQESSAVATGKGHKKNIGQRSDGPEFFFFAGYDIHSQILALQNDLADGPQEGQGSTGTFTLTRQAGTTGKIGDAQRPTAIIATHPGVLQPVLHHLDVNATVNVSMGYPLGNAPLCQLVENLLVLDENRNHRGEYLKKDLLAVLASPCLRCLPLEDTQADLQDRGQDLPIFADQAIDADANHDDPNSVSDVPCLRDTLDAMVALLRQKGPRLDHDDIFLAFEHEQAKYEAKLGRLRSAGHETTGYKAPFQPVGMAREMLEQCLELAINALSAVRNSGDLATWLIRLTDFFVSHGGNYLASQPLDAELVYHLRFHTIPELAETVLAEEILPKPALYGLLRQLIAGERVPFEAEDINGIQVLGLLETRLLDFGRICILDATDDILPGGVGNDPLLPDSLRPAIGLPDARTREAAAAYNLYRLLQSADEVHFYWQEGITKSTLFDGRKDRSRFVEQIIWEEEKRRAASAGKGKSDPDSFLLKPGDASFKAAVSRVAPIVTHPALIRKTKAADVSMQNFLAGKISTGDLDTWLKCPLQFYFARLCRISDSGSGDDNENIVVGLCVHEVLKQLYGPYKGQVVSLNAPDPSVLDDIQEDELKNVFADVLREGPEKTGDHWGLTVDSYIMLGLTGPRRIRKFLEAQPAQTRILELEKKLEKPVTIMGKEYCLHGVIDRLDEREVENEGGQERVLVILDYKTGNVARFLPDLVIWSKSWSGSFSQRLAATCKLAQNGDLPKDTDGPQAFSSLVAEVAELVPSLQLLVYLLLVEAEVGKIPADACYVDLKDSGCECSIFGSGKNKDGATHPDPAQVAETCRNILAAVLMDMQTCQVFAGREGDHCDYCKYAGVCRQWDHGVAADSGN